MAVQIPLFYVSKDVKCRGCIGCKSKVWPERLAVHAFHVAKVAQNSGQRFYHKICKWGEYQEKLARRFDVKVRQCSESHRKKYNERVKRGEFSGPTMTKEAWAIQFGWQPAIMLRDLLEAYAHGICQGGCAKPFKDYALSDMSVDIIRRNEAPVWGRNTRFLCRNDNTRKGRMSPRDLAIMQLGYEFAQGKISENDLPDWL